jgi:methionine aminopeptidase
MTKRYATTYSNGHTFETSSCHEARNIINYGDQQTFSLSGVPVSAKEFFVAANEHADELLAKKSETHKQVRVRHGSSALSYVTKWIPR